MKCTVVIEFQAHSNDRGGYAFSRCDLLTAQKSLPHIVQWSVFSVSYTHLTLPTKRIV